MRTFIGVIALGLAVPATLLTTVPTNALAQVQLRDGTLVQPGIVVSPPAVVVEPAPVVVVPAPGTLTAADVALGASPVASYVYVERRSSDIILPTKGPIKVGGPKYDPLGRKIYASRPIGR